MPPPRGRPSSVGRILKAGKRTKRKIKIKIQNQDENDIDIHSDEEEEEVHKFLMGDVFNLIDQNNPKFWDSKLKRKKGQRVKNSQEMTPQVEKMLQNATDLYLSGKIDQAVVALKELIKQAPGLHDPFHILGVIYEQEYKDVPSACAYYLLAAHLAPDDVELWKRISEMSIALNNVDQAIYCLKKCLKNSKSNFDEEASYELSMIYMNSGKYKAASTHLNKLFNLCPGDYSIANNFAKCKRLLGDDRMVCDILETHVSTCRANSINQDSIPTSEHITDSRLDSDNLNAPDEKIYDSVNNSPQESTLTLSLDALDSLATARLIIGDFRPINGVNLQGSLAVKSYICHIYNESEYPHNDINEEIDKISILEKYALILAMGSVFAHRKNLESAGIYYLKAIDIAREESSRGIHLMHSRDALEISKTLVSIDNIDGAIEALRMGIQTPENLLDTLKSGDNWKAALRLSYLFDIQQTKSFAVTARLELFNLLSDIGRFSEADLLLSALTSEDLGNTQALAPPIATSDRHSLLTTLADLSLSLSNSLLKNPSSRMPPCLTCRSFTKSTTINPGLFNDAKSFLQGLFALLNDFEQDTLRIRTHMRSQPQLIKPIESLGSNVNSTKSLILPLKSLSNEVSRSHKGSSYMRVKRHLDLVSPEDILGWDGYSQLLENSAIILCSLRIQHPKGESECLRQFIELLETISRNRKQYKFVVQDHEKRQFKNRIDGLSRSVSAFFGIYKMALGYIKSEYSSPREPHPLRTLGRILASSRIAASAAISLSSCPERDTLLEIKTWAVRHLINSPNDLDLAMLVAHFCSLSGRWQFAIAEYSHALSLSRDNPLAHLCLAAAHLGSVTSKTTRSIDESILQCFAHLDHCKQLRINGVYCKVLKQLMTAESSYNFARAYHHLGLLHLALPLYHSCLDILEGLSALPAPVSWTCPCFLCEQDMLRSDDARSRCTVDHSTIGLDAPSELLRSCAHNLRLLYISQQCLTTANVIGNKYLTWD